MTRAKARTIGTEVNSFLSQLLLDHRETWMLPQTEVLCLIRFEENSYGDAREEVQVSEEEASRKEKIKDPSRRTSGPGPGHPAKAAGAAATQLLDIRPGGPEIRRKLAEPEEKWHL
jgi:hypothetical protein